MDIEYRKASPEDLEQIWDMNIADNPGNDRWRSWKKTYIAYNRDGDAFTFVILYGGVPVGEGTLIFSPACGAVGGRTELADNKTTANINALRIRKEHEGKGYISALVHMMEDYAVKNGYTYLTIGVEAREARNLGIYLHWGYNEFITWEIQEENLVLYYRKKLETPFAGRISYYAAVHQ